jgi:hypothetical protein
MVQEELDKTAVSAAELRTLFDGGARISLLSIARPVS